MSHAGHHLSNAIRQQARAALGDLAHPNVYLISSYDGQGHIKVTIRQDPGAQPIESNWMPLGQIGVGNGWGISVGPEIGDQVMVVFEGGDINSGVVVARIHSSVAASMPVPSGETWMQHKLGTYIKLLNTGDLAVFTDRDANVTTTRDLNATVGNNANVTVEKDANLAVTGTITSSAAQWNHTGPVSIIGTLNVKNTITGTGGLALSTTFGSAGGSAASITGNITANNGTFNGTSWDFVADGYSLKTHETTGVTAGSDLSGPPAPS